MADETESNAPPPRQAARSALNRMRATAPDDNVSEAGARPEFQLDHYIAPVSDCVHTMVVMLAFPNASFGDNNRYLTKNLYGSLFVADCTREAVVQTYRSARAEQREGGHEEVCRRRCEEEPQGHHGGR